MYLFVDSTHLITLGILDSKLEWLDYKYINEKKISSSIHSHMDTMLKDNEISTNSLKGIIQISGPGSYTGMRVSEGITQIFNWQGFKRMGFYHFNVPAILGNSDYMWIANAFKKEFFCFRFFEGKAVKTLVKSSHLNDFIDANTTSETDFFCGHADHVDLMDNEKQITPTSKLIKESGKAVFKYIESEEINEELYYFRPLEQEFSKSIKI